MSFNEFGGREVKVGAVDSSCEPRLQMVSRFEYLAFTCMGTDSRSRMKAYGMDGHETWEESLGGTFGVPEFRFAPVAGRFAISRISSPDPGAEDLGFGNVLPATATQEVRVYQTESGDMLLKVPTTPVTRAAENFDLSEDGLVAAMVTDGTIQVYKLPPPSKQDMKDLELARSFSPPVSEAPVRFAKLEAPANGAGEDVAATERRVSAGSGGASGVGGAAGPEGGAGGGPGGGSAAVAGDVTKATGARSPAAAQSGDAAGQGGDDADAGRRRPPTLLEPGETVETVKGSGQQPK
jgi:hypothetical protein